MKRWPDITPLEKAEAKYRDEDWLKSVHRIRLEVPGNMVCFAPDIFGAKFDRDTVIEWVTNDRKTRGQEDLKLKGYEFFDDLKIKRVYNRATMNKSVSRKWRDTNDRSKNR